MSYQEQPSPFQQPSQQWPQPQAVYPPHPQQQTGYPPASSPQYPQYPQPQYNPQYAQAPYQQPMPPQTPYPYQQQPYVQPMMMQNVNVNVQQRGPGFLMRALYFLFIGWWAGYIWLSIGFGLCAMIITLPLGLIMLNRLPQVMTLKASGATTNVNVSTMSMQAGPYGQPMMVQNVNVNISGTQQHNFLLRAIYFIFIGCWAGYLWANLAYLCCVTLVLLPVGVMMFDRLPAVLTLRRN